MNAIISKAKADFDEAVGQLTKELDGIRAGRANPALVEHITADVYGTPTPILQLAAITTPDSKTITIQPWDKSTIEPIQKALANANLGMQPVVQENRILLAIPALTGERRQELLKVLGKKVEEARVRVRTHRDYAKSAIGDLEKKKEISEDEKFRLQKELQELADGVAKTIEGLETKKTTELTTV